MPELTEAIVGRRIAMIQGVCPCGARIQVRTGDVLIEHHVGCAAEDGAISALTEPEPARRGLAAPPTCPEGHSSRAPTHLTGPPPPP